MPSHKNTEYAIIGGGIAGLCLAIALHHRNINVRVYEAASQFGEIGAGVGFTPNAIQAMRICHPGIHASFEKIAELDRSNSEFVYDCYDVNGITDELATPTFQLRFKGEIKGIHRAQFLNELVKSFPKDRVEFGKRLEEYNEADDGTLTLRFRDGTTAVGNAIIGCDGIKSRVRTCMFGDNHPCTSPSYTHKYAYRAIVSLEATRIALGADRCNGPTIFFGQDGHILTLPIHNYNVLQIVAFYTDRNEWPEKQQLTVPVDKDEMFEDFQSFGPNWAIFDLFFNPPPTYSKGRVCILGDAAHASSPHHGAGAGMCIEDAAVLSELLAEPHITSVLEIEAAFAVYDAVRRPRGEMLVASSRFTGEAYQGQQPDVGRNWEVLAREIYYRTGRIHDVDVGQFCEEACMVLKKQLGSQRGS